MKRELGALILLLALFGAAAFNIRAADRLTDEIETHLGRSEKALLAGDRAYAETELEAALRIWRSAEHYTHIFIRHGEIDAVTDTFCSLLGAIKSRDTSDIFMAQLTLHSRLNELVEMERVTPGSIL